MSSSAGVNVLRYSALGLGVFYGIYHQRSITSSQKSAAVKREYEHKQSLIDQAKAEYKKSKAPASTSSSTSGGPNQDPMDPNLDVETYLNTFRTLF